MQVGLKLVVASVGDHGGGADKLLSQTHGTVPSWLVGSAGAGDAISSGSVVGKANIQ